MKYLKPPLTYEQQVDLLISRGLIVSDKEYAVSLLECMSSNQMGQFSPVF